MDVKRNNGSEIYKEDIEITYELLYGKKYIEKLERLISKVRKEHHGEVNCSICQDIKELDEEYEKVRKKFNGG